MSVFEGHDICHEGPLAGGSIGCFGNMFGSAMTLSLLPSAAWASRLSDLLGALIWSPDCTVLKNSAKGRPRPSPSGGGAGRRPRSSPRVPTRTGSDQMLKRYCDRCALRLLLEQGSVHGGMHDPEVAIFLCDMFTRCGTLLCSSYQRLYLFLLMAQTGRPRWAPWTSSRRAVSTWTR